MDKVIEFAQQLWFVYLETAPWLMLGLLVAAGVKIFSDHWPLQKWLGGDSVGTIIKASLIGAPLPLCSCGVLPAAIAMRRAGASREATVAFLISTPETGADSVAVSYSLLGPIMAIIRPVAAVSTAIAAGIAVKFLPEGEISAPPTPSCCDGHKQPANTKPSLDQALRFAFKDLLADIAGWLIVGLCAAALLMVLFEPGQLAEWGRGPLAMLIMLLIGIPMYVCATASTPIAAAMLIAGVSPGVAMVFLLTGPATNIAGLLVLRKELGTAVVATYVATIMLCSLIIGLVIDYGFAGLFDTSQVTLGHAHIVPHWLAVSCALILAPLILWPAIKNLRQNHA